MFTKKIQNPFESGKCTQSKIRVQNIKLSTKLIVDENQVAYIVIKNKPLDKFATGEFKLEGGMIPKTFQVCNLGKPRKKNISKKIYYAKSFKGAIIFINLQEYSNFDFKTHNILLFDRLSDFRFKLVGKYNFTITNVDAFAKFVANYSRGNEYVVKKLNAYVSKRIRYEFHKEEFEIENFIMKNNEIFEKIKTKLNKRLGKIGIEVSSIEISDCILNKRNQEKINEFVSEGKIKLFYSLGDENVISQ